MPNYSAISSPSSASPARQLAFNALKEIYRGGYADVVLHRLLGQNPLAAVERQLATELVYGTVRRQRTLDALIDQLGKKGAQQQPPDLRIVLHLGLYQLRYLDQIPESAAVNTSVELIKVSGKTKLAGVVNGILRQYIRLRQTSSDPLALPDNPLQAIAVQHSYPDWIVELWLRQIGSEQTQALCDWLNRPPTIDLRINPLKTTLAEVKEAFLAADIKTETSADLPQLLRLTSHAGSIRQLPGYEAGWWTVQDASAQLVSHVMNPKAGETVIDACAAPGGKTTHLAELMNDQGTIWACDRTKSRLSKVKQTVRRLGFESIQSFIGDSTRTAKFANSGDRVLVDAPCSGLGTLHRHADARWRQTPTTVSELVALQTNLLSQAATWVKPEGMLVYVTCTLHPEENEQQIDHFLATHPQWKILPLEPEDPGFAYATPAGWIQIWPHLADQDGFFMVRLGRQ